MIQTLFCQKLYCSLLLLASYQVRVVSGSEAARSTTVLVTKRKMFWNMFGQLITLKFHLKVRKFCRKSFLVCC